MEGEASELVTIQPRSGGSDVSPGRKPRVKWEIFPSRVSGDRVLTQTLKSCPDTNRSKPEFFRWSVKAYSTRMQKDQETLFMGATLLHCRTNTLAIGSS